MTVTAHIGSSLNRLWDSQKSRKTEIASSIFGLLSELVSARERSGGEVSLAERSVSERNGAEKSKGRDLFHREGSSEGSSSCGCQEASNQMEGSLPQALPC